MLTSQKKSIDTFHTPKQFRVNKFLINKMHILQKKKKKPSKNSNKQFAVEFFLLLLETHFEHFIV